MKHGGSNASSIRFASLVLGLSLALCRMTAATAQTTLFNVSYDATRGLYRDINVQFAANWKSKTGENVAVRMSHGGSSEQARAVIGGLDASIVTLAIAADVDEIAQQTGKIPADWRKRFPNNSSPCMSTIVFMVRKGNPKGIRDWADLTRPGIQVVLPNPRTSGAAKWSYFAAWAYAHENFKGDESRMVSFMTSLFKNVAVFDSSSHGAIETFKENNVGDVLITWEDDADAIMQNSSDNNFVLITPSVSILAEPVVSLVDGNVDTEGKRKLARAYLDYLYSPVAQSIFATHYFRPVAFEYAPPDRFRSLRLFTVEDLFGTWHKAVSAHFGPGGLLDRIMRNTEHGESSPRNLAADYVPNADEGRR